MNKNPIIKQKIFKKVVVNNLPFKYQLISFVHYKNF